VAFRSIPVAVAAFATPTASVDIGDAAVAGVGPFSASSQHQHAVPAPAPGYATYIAGAPADGGGTAPALSTHVHGHPAADHQAGAFSDLTGYFSRKALAADAVCFVSSGGNDANDGLSAGSAKATVAAAIAALPNGGRIEVGAGLFNITATIAPGAGIKIRGVGSEVSKALHDTEAATEETAVALLEPTQTTFKWTGAAGGTMFRPLAGAHGVYIENVRFDCNDLADIGMSWVGTFDCWYDQITVENFTHGVGHAVELVGIPGTAQGNVTRTDGGLLRTYRGNVPLYISGNQAAGNYVTLNTLRRLFAWDVKTLGIDFVANCDSNAIDVAFIELDNTSGTILGGVRFNGSATPGVNVDADGNVINWMSIDQHDAVTLGPWAVIVNAAHLNYVRLAFTIFPAARLVQINYPLQEGNTIIKSNDRQQGWRTPLVPFEIAPLGRDWVNGEPTHKGHVRYSSNTGDANSDGGVEFKVSEFGAGYGWRMSAWDGGGGLVPFAVMARNASAAWTEVFRWLMDGANLVGGIRVNGAAAMYSGNGVPAAGLGANGDFYFRFDTPGTANQRLYVKAAGAWTGIL
jgi:hypothetical protein